MSHLTPQGTEGHNTASVGGFVMLPPVIMAAVAAAAAGAGGEAGANNDAIAAAAAQQALTHLRLTHESKKLAAVAERYAQLLARVALVSERASVQGEGGGASQRVKSDDGCVVRLFCCLNCSAPNCTAQRMIPRYLDAYTPVLQLAPSHHHQGEPLKDLAAAEARRVRFNPQVCLGVGVCLCRGARAGLLACGAVAA
jgi:hypothetical protein